MDSAPKREAPLDNGRRQRARPGYARWYIAYFLLAAFDILTVTGSLVLHLRLLEIYEESVDTNRLWAEQLESYVELEILISAANAPGNDIFASQNPELEAIRLKVAMNSFHRKMDEVRKSVQVTSRLAPETEWATLLDEIEAKVELMAATTGQIVELFAAGDIAGAGPRMAQMDRIYADINLAVNRLESESQEIQKASLQHQLVLAQQMRSLEYVIGALIALMVLGVAIYGHRLSRQMTRHEKEQEEHLEALEVSERRFRGLAEGSIQGIAVHAEGRPFFVNRAWASIHGFTNPEEAAKVADVLELVAEIDRGRVREVHRLLESGDTSSQRYEYQAVRQDGSKVWLECMERVVPWRNVNAVQSTVIDITERKLAESELHLAIARAEQATNTRTRFFAAASHDLRQPLHAIGLYLPLIEKRMETADGREMVTSVRRSAESMRALLDSLLDISKLDAGVIEPNIGDVSIIDIMDQLAMEFAPQAAGLGIDLRVVPVDYRVRSDASLLQRILRNLLSNALRYTSEGKVLMGARRVNGKIRIEVWDTGSGIEEDEQARIFEEFYQARSAGAEHGSGLGLGLAIIERLARLLGHEIAMRSRPGKGSVFCVTAEEVSDRPRRAANLTATGMTARDLRGLLAFLVDDDPAVLAGMRSILEDWGLDVLEADSSTAAERCVVTDGRIPHIICADLRLDGEDTGLLAVEKIRRAAGQEIPAVIITADTDPDRIVKVTSQGLAITHKPIQPEELRRIIAKIARKSTRGEDAPEARSSTPSVLKHA